jgi:hypothetical protein
MLSHYKSRRHSVAGCFAAKSRLILGSTKRLDKRAQSGKLRAFVAQQPVCWPTCTSVRIFSLNQVAVQRPPLFQPIGKKVSHATMRAGLCQAWVESNRVQVYRTVTGVDEA